MLLLFVPAVFGQTSNWVNIGFPVLQNIKVVSEKQLPVITTSDFERGYIEISDAIVLQVSSNTDWQIVVRSTRENLYTTPGRYKSVSDFRWRLENQPFRQLETKPQVVIKGPAGTHNKMINLDYRIILDWQSTPPGDWEFAHEFSIEPDIK